jgi:hypothetical protein
MRNGGVQIESASTVPLASDGGEDGALRTIREGLAASGVHKCDAYVAVGRSLAEIRRVTLPVLPEDELPDVIRFQAPRQFTNVAEDWPIDFVPTRVDADGIEVMAAAIAPQNLARIVRFCGDAQLELQSVGLRPLAAAALYVRGIPQGDRGLLFLVDRFVEDADIVLLRDGIPVFVRSLRLPDEEEAARKQLVAELRRSWMACAELLGEQRSVGMEHPPRVVIWGKSKTHAPEVEAIRESLQVDVGTVDPFDLVQVDADLRTSLGDHVGRFAPLLGLLKAHADGQTAWIDFLNPRRRPEPKSQRGRVLVYAALAAIAAAAGFGLIWRQLGQLDQQIAGRLAESKALDPFVVKAAESVNALNLLKAFEQTDIDWLGELARTSDRLPSANEVLIEKFAGSMVAGGGGRIDLSGRAVGPNIVTQLEEALRDETHVVRGEGSQADPREPAYAWTFKDALLIRSGTSDYVVADQEAPESQKDQKEAKGDRPIEAEGQAGTPATTDSEPGGATAPGAGGAASQSVSSNEPSPSSAAEPSGGSGTSAGQTSGVPVSPEEAPAASQEVPQ